VQGKTNLSFILQIQSLKNLKILHVVVIGRRQLMDECTYGICIAQESKSIRSRFWEQCNGSIHHSNDSWSSKITNARNQSKSNATCIMLHINLNCHGYASQYYLNLQASFESDLARECGVSIFSYMS
jgi:hypothetical protein